MTPFQRTPMIALCAIALTTALAAGCGSSSKSGSSNPTTSAPAPAMGSASNTITISNFKFGDPLTVKAGAEVTVKNSDDTPHTVTADDDAFDTDDIAGGASKPFVAPKAGTYKFHCNIHNYMQGTLEVTA